MASTGIPQADIGFSFFSMHTTQEKNITFVGSQMNGPTNVGVDNVEFPQHHEGHSGWEIYKVAALVPSPALNDSPHIVLLLIGTNDVLHSMFEGATDRVGDLIDNIISNVPDALIAVATIPPLTGDYSSYSDLVDSYNVGLKEAVNTRIQNGRNVILVDQFDGFPTSELEDGIHPNADGCARMGDKWYGAISSVLPAK